jgi:hypothetical protein
MRRPRVEWATIIGEFEQSGEAHAEFCARRRLNLGSFRSWLYRLRRSSASGKVGHGAARGVQLLPVRIVGPDPAARPHVEILVAGLVLRLSGSDVEYVATLTAALASRC